MTFVLKGAVSALAISCGLAAMSAAPAHAYTLMDMLRGDRQRTQNTIFMDQMPPGRVAPRGSAGGSLGLDPEAPLPKVSGPRYYTYKTEALQFVDTSKFADPIVTGAVAEVSPASDSGTEPVVQRRFLAQARVRANADVAKALEAYYGDNRNPLVWIDGNQISERAKSAIAALADAASVGLDPADYAVQTPTVDPANPDPAVRDRAMMQFELELSGKVLAFVQDTVRGRIDPNKISGYHDFQRKAVNLAPVLKLARMSPNAGAYIASRSPDSPQFEALKAELAKLRAAGGSEEQIVISLTGLLRPGDSSPEIANIVKALQKHGSETLKTDHAATLAAYAGGSDYSPEIVALVEDFQKERGLKPDGVIGQATVRAMTGGDTNASKIDKLVVAMEQARWLPEDLGSRYVMINQPAYMAYYHNDGKEQLSMRVVVGGKNNQTYFFNDQIETVEFNPFWGVPQSIIINEMLPKLRSDPNYLDQLGYEVEVNGHAVASSSVDWYGSTANVSVRQPPSSDNALGELKILFPNSHAIYMHDTPSKSFFKRDMRALSHGCVRLANPRAMAAAVLGTTMDDIARQIASGQNHAVKVPQKIPVYVSYFTAWPNKDGVVEYFDDVYGRDAYVEKAFDATSKARGAQI
ncbi:L,D-transpeptidase family protein [Rhizobium bangladeshense]|uniref:L,D-transpeptidase family protein n=1 Tax=Rhizobium bangladeshense TaxID=1138189 RepID=UPI001A983D4B|nr:murein L,D-transpeptidase [Rhizobium bangladeshense]MBX4913127.1 murein L,D-transpeptidase [Rhizobium bangladeshense]MBX4930847.1 murein L,D-transpeptidase [Rhizobium bangladeshense]MBY3580851.1 murein L,D-transpeptidase [Rhizobium bangladeshense]QSY86950.1 murein L,D-transpeptidase [Rhizobium bangladeshense]QSY92774.1 murein L,D-transpeptidase [Rhizobium bangladeshense]